MDKLVATRQPQLVCDQTEVIGLLCSQMSTKKRPWSGEDLYFMAKREGSKMFPSMTSFFRSCLSSNIGHPRSALAAPSDSVLAKTLDASPPVA